MECPNCGALFTTGANWDSGEPDFVPGWLCPECGAFVPADDDEWPDEDESEAA